MSTQSVKVTKDLEFIVAQGPDLCEVCQTISFQALINKTGFKHISDPKSLYNSGQKCVLCSLIHQSISDVFPYPSKHHWNKSSDSTRFITLYGIERENFGLDHILVCYGAEESSFQVGNHQNGTPQGTILTGRLEISANKDDPASRFIKYRKIPREPGSDGGMFMATQLFVECVSTHSRCKPPQKTSLPTRILDVTRSSEDKISLFVSGDHEAEYAALSYCWGGPQEIVATKNSLGLLIQGIALSDFPKTIRDAIAVTRNLGLRFLWVDALCILQDSSDDWALESSKMADIYGNATVTIAATGGSHCDAGCFINGSRGNYPEIRTIKLPLPDSTIGTISLSIQNAYLAGKGPLYKRAWALQERLLSPRLILYGSGSVSWQCQTKAPTSGVGSARLPDFLFDQITTASHNTRQWNERVSEQNSQTLDKFWMQIAVDYSRRDVTYEQDKLPALSGLAQKYQEVTGDTYLAGLWNGTLCQGLMWHTQYESEYQRSTYIAPTWSWLSVSGPVLYANSPKTNDSLVEILEAETVLASSDKTGAVLGGRITLRGHMKEARRTSIRDLQGVGEDESLVGSALTDLTPTAVDAMDGPLLCLRIFEDRGLLLKPAGENYRRVGIFIVGLEVDGIAGDIWFKDCELQTITIV